MNPVLWFFINRPGLMAGLLPFLLLFCFWIVSYCLRKKSLARHQEEQNDLPLTEEVPLASPRSSPYYRFSDEQQVPPSSEHSEGLLPKLRWWTTDYLVTHFAVISVLGVVALGGVTVTSILSRMRLSTIWAILCGILLFLIYLVFVGVIILLVNKISRMILRRFGKHPP